MTQPIVKSMSSEEIRQQREEMELKAELKALEPISFEEFDKIVHEWILLTDTGIIKLLAAVVIANRFKGRDPVWAMIIGPSGGGKTELLSMLFNLTDIYPISLLTPNTLLSGMPGLKDNSLLPQISGKTIVFKDWTNILSQNKDSRNEILGQLREVYDGHMKKPFGNGRVAEWKGKIGLIAGVTPAYDLSQQMHATLGERFINYRVIMPNRKEAGRRALSNGPKQEEMRRVLKNAFYAFMKGIEIPKEESKLPEEVKEELISVANFSTMARSGVIREFSYKREVIFVPAAEMPTRIVQALAILASAITVINKGIFNKEDINIIYRVALDSIPQTNYMVIKEMARGDERTTAEIATDIGYPTSPVRMYLENLALLGVSKRIKGSESEEGGSADKWTLDPEFKEIVQRYEEIKIIEAEVAIEKEKEIELDSDPEGLFN